MISVSRALIIDEPWIGYILEGKKNWEMRSRNTKIRGWFGLIRKGSGKVVGVANLVEVRDPLSRLEKIATFGNHRVPESEIRSRKVARWSIPWVLSDVKPLERPVAYQHKSGAVTWVKLEPEVSKAIARELERQNHHPQISGKRTVT